LGKRENVPAPIAGELVRAALQGTPYPFSILQRAIERTRAEIGKDDWPDLERRDARVALIKAVLLRTLYREVTPTMDPTNASPGYLCGRLMAVIERLQQLALGDVNASVVDRYFGAASATPRAVFVRLLRNTPHHARKAQDDPARSGTAVWLKRQIDEIASRFDPKHNGFPAFLDLEQQGLFILGYHQQRHALWTKRPAAPGAAAEEAASAPAA
jgi:CRISPR-associated protein Csd1